MKMIAMLAGAAALLLAPLPLAPRAWAADNQGEKAAPIVDCATIMDPVKQHECQREQQSAAPTKGETESRTPRDCTAIEDATERQKCEHERDAIQTHRNEPVNPGAGSGSNGTLGTNGITEQPAAPGVEAPLEKHDEEPIGTP